MMTTPGKSASHLPQANLACLQHMAAEEVLASWVAAHPHGTCARETAGKLLANILPWPDILAPAANLDLIQEQDGFLIARARMNGVGPGHPKSGTPAQNALRMLAARALNAPPASGKNKRDLPALALRQLYGLDELAPWPAAQQARCALLKRIVASMGGAFAESASAPLKAFKFDEMSRRIYLAFAGLQRGTVLQADAILLSKALGGPADTVQALTVTIIRAAISARQATGAEIAEASNIESFARAIKKLASRLETKPYAGKVAIAQVYDAGLAQGLNLGTLDSFKEKLAEAAREALIDLERYDITGPLDPSLKERSRLRLGRDERHFIVNQWI